MAINPTLTTTVRVGELPSAPFSGSDLIPHEVGSALKKGTLTELAAFLGSVITVNGAVGFRAVTVTDGQTLPSVTLNKQEFILVGKGTFQNVGGGSPITTTEELNALVTNGVTWSLGVAIPIDVEAAGIVQTIRQGFTETAPSENAIFVALAGKQDAGAEPPPPIKITAIASGINQVFQLPLGFKAGSVFKSRGLLYRSTDWTQTNDLLTIIVNLSIGNTIYIKP